MPFSDRNKCFPAFGKPFEIDFDKKIKKKQYLGLTERSLCGIL